MKPLENGACSKSIGMIDPSGRPNPKSSANKIAPWDDLVGISMTIWCEVVIVDAGVILIHIKFL